DEPGSVRDEGKQALSVVASRVFLVMSFAAAEEAPRTTRATAVARWQAEHSVAAAQEARAAARAFIATRRLCALAARRDKVGVKRRAPRGRLAAQRGPLTGPVGEPALELTQDRVVGVAAGVSAAADRPATARDRAGRAAGPRGRAGGAGRGGNHPRHDG